MKSDAQPPRFAVIGAGFAGLTAAMRLSRQGADVTVFERWEGIGGVWFANQYPGAACDVPSFLYSWSFAPKPDWARRFATQPEILDYIERTVDRFGIRDRIRTGHRVTALTWNEPDAVWTIEFADQAAVTADFVVAALGQMSSPAVPALPGISGFEGRHFHTADWDHAVELRDRHVVVIGAGASALQVVPAIVDVARSVTVLQRSPGYILEKGDLEYTSSRSSLTNRAARFQSFLSKELKTPRLVRWPKLVASSEAAYRASLRQWVPDDVLRAKLEPADVYGCKRILVSNDWFSTLQRPTVSLHDASVTRIARDSMHLSDGTDIPVDVIVYGTGFHASAFLNGIDVRGVDGRLLGAEWRRSPRAYLGMTMPSFPNLFLLYGPNTNPAWNSVLVMIESQVHYLVSVAKRWKRGGPFRMEVRDRVFDRFARQLAKRTRRSVWVTGCRNWFTTSDGTNTQNWPALVSEYWFRTRWVRWTDYVVRPLDRARRPVRLNR